MIPDVLQQLQLTPTANCLCSDRCGEQVWRGACLMADFMLSKLPHLSGATVMELGAGVGLVSVLASTVAQHVFVTDVNTTALDLAAINIASNQVRGACQVNDDDSCTAHGCSSETAISGTAAAEDQDDTGTVSTRCLDWMDFLGIQPTQLSDEDMLSLLQGQEALAPSTQYHSPTEVAMMAEDTVQLTSGPVKLGNTHCQATTGDDVTGQAVCMAQLDATASSTSGSSHHWRPSDLLQLQHATVLLAADVVYDESLTEAFMHTAWCIMQWVSTRHGKQKQQTNQSAQTEPRALASSDPVLYVALEKRFNFTLQHMDVRATAYDHFMTFIQHSDSQAAAAESGRPSSQESSSQTQQQHQQPEAAACDQAEVQDCQSKPEAAPRFVGRQLDISDVPQVLELCCLEVGHTAVPAVSSKHDI
eukprot:jgi/Chrzof1/13132/Cz07g21040.t1